MEGGGLLLLFCMYTIIAVTACYCSDNSSFHHIFPVYFFFLDIVEGRGCSKEAIFLQIENDTFF